MAEKRVQFNQIVKSQLPEYVQDDFPLVGEFLSQYYQGQDVVALRLVGQYTESEQANQIESAKENEAAKQLGTVTLPAILIGTAMVCLAAGFYVYYQNGGGITDLGVDEPSSEPESSPEMAPTTEEDSTEEEAADDSSDGDSDAEEDSDDSDDEQSDSDDADQGGDEGSGGEENIHSSAQGGFG